MRRVTFTVVDSPLGRVLVAGTSRGVTAVKLGDRAAPLVRELVREYPEARPDFVRGRVGRWARALLRYLDGRSPALRLPVDVAATPFERLVWTALAAIPRGETRTYAELARAIGRPAAARAVARACAANPVALVVPCHRVVPATGGTGGYRWGAARKARLLALEGVQVPDTSLRRHGATPGRRAGPRRQSSVVGSGEPQ